MVVRCAAHVEKTTRPVFLIAGALASAYAQSGVQCPGPITINLDGGARTYQLAAPAWATGISATGASLTLSYNDRAYIVPACSAGAWSPGMFSEKLPMLNTVWNFTVSLSGASCGCNAALYAVAMPAVDASGNPAPSNGGDYYCDANQVGGFWCTEVDIVEANGAALASTPHACDAAQPSGFVPGCDKGGCGVNTKDRSGAFGAGPSFAINTQLPFTVVAEMPAPNGTLAAVTTTLWQGGRSVVLAHVDATCGAGYLERVSAGLARGMVPTLSVWGSESSGADMTWLDSPPCDAATGCNAGVKATFYDISVTSAGPPPPPPPPGNCKPQVGVDIGGATLRAMIETDFTGCCQRCVDEPACVGSVYYASSFNCVLKSSAGTPTQNADATSGTVARAVAGKQK